MVSPAQPPVQMKATAMEEKHIIALIPSLSYPMLCASARMRLSGAAALPEPI